MAPPPSQEPGDPETRLAEVIEDYLHAVDRGEPLDPSVVMARHPELRDDLGEFFAGQRAAARLGRAARDDSGVAALATPAGASGGTVGNHEILEELARGGMGVVFRAREKKLGRIVALKVILAGALASAEQRERFLREAKAVAALDHPHIVPIYEVGESGGLQYFTMKLLEGGNLGTWSPPGGRTPQRVAVMVELVAQAVHHANERGILHRDLKPSNILLDRGGLPCLSDFGLARALELDSSLTASGDLVGTASYMAPEQARGRAGDLTRAADIYSLGAVLYELLTGSPPFRGATTVEILRSAQEDEPARPSFLNRLVPIDLETICLKCLEKQPARRYASAGELAEDLRSFLEGRPISARPASRIERARRWCRRHPLPSLTVLFLLVVALGSLAATLLIYRSRQESMRSLANARVAEARALALTGGPGGRLRGLSALREAARERRDLEVRNAAILCLSLPDVEVSARVPSLLPRLGRHALDPTHQRLAEGYATGEVIVREVLTGRTLARFPGDGAWVRGLVFSPDGRFLARSTALGHIDGGLTVWAWESGGAPVVSIDGGVTSRIPAFDAEGHQLVYGLNDGTVRALDIATGKQLLSLAIGHGARELGYCPRGRAVAARVDGDRVIVLDLDTGAKTFEEAGSAFSWHPGGELLALASGADAMVWDLSTRRPVATLRGHLRTVTYVLFHPGGELLLTASHDQTFRLWSKSGQELLRHEGEIHDPSFSLDGDSIGARAPDGSLRRWRFTRSRELSWASAGGPAIHSVSFDPDDRLLAAAHSEGITLLEPADGSVRARIGQKPVASVFFARDGGSTITASYRGVHRWPLRREEQDGRAILHSGPPEALIPEHSNSFAAALSPDEGHLLVCLGSNEALLVDLRDHSAPPRRLAQVNVASVAVARGGRWAATGPLHGLDARVWDGATGSMVKSYTLPREVMSARVGFSPDAKWFALSTGEGLSFFRAGEWDEPVRRFPRDEPIDLGCPFAFSSDSRLVAFSLATGSIRLVEMEGGREIATLQTLNLRFVSEVALSGSSDRLAAVLDGGIIQLWDLRQIRASLRELGLDWEGPDLPAPAPIDRRRLEVQVDWGTPARRKGGK